MTIELHNRKNPCGEIALPIGNNLPRANTMSQLMSGDRSSFYTPYMPTFTKPKYQFSRTNWYVAVYNYNYYHEVEAWCTEQFGAPCGQPDAWSRWIHLPFYDEIHFRDERDYIWFTLRWS